MTNPCAFSKNHKCIKWTDYELIHHDLEKVDELCHDKWIEIQHLRDYIDFRKSCSFQTEYSKDERLQNLMLNLRLRLRFSLAI